MTSEKAAEVVRIVRQLRGASSSAGVDSAVEEILRVLGVPAEQVVGVNVADRTFHVVLEAQFRTFRDDVDSDHLLDVFDLCLGWLHGRGVGHDLALKLIDRWHREEMRHEVAP